MRPMTKYRFTLPDGQTHAGTAPEIIFGQYPDAVITHVWRRNDAGAVSEEPITPPLRFESQPITLPEPEAGFSGEIRGPAADDDGAPTPPSDTDEDEG